MFVLHWCGDRRRAALQEQVTRAYREVLWRDPDADGLADYVRGLAAGELTLEQVRQALLQSPEYTELLSPLLAEIRTVYTRFLLREPQPEEVERHLERFREMPPPDVASALQDGRLRTLLGVRPLNLEMDVTNQCNLRCITCQFSTPEIYKQKRHDISVADFSRIAEQLFPLCHRLSLSVSTEPLLHRQFADLLGICHRYEVPFVFINTNGLLMNDRLIEAMITAPLHGIAISVDAATKATHERIRVGSNFDRLLANIRALNEAKRRRQADHPRITFNYVLMRQNVTELPAVVELAHELGVEGVAVTHVVVFDFTQGKVESLATCAADRQLCNRMLEEARTLAAKYQIVVELPEPFAEEPPAACQERHTPEWFNLNLTPQEATSSCCQFPWHFVAIDPYGYVAPCGWWYGEERMGNLRTESFEAIWNNERYRALRAEHQTGALRRTCRTCPAAGVGVVDNPAAFTVKSGVGKPPAVDPPAARDGSVLHLPVV